MERLAENVFNETKYANLTKQYGTHRNTNTRITRTRFSAGVARVPQPERHRHVVGGGLGLWGSPLRDVLKTRPSETCLHRRKGPDGVVAGREAWKLGRRQKRSSRQQQPGLGERNRDARYKKRRGRGDAGQRFLLLTPSSTRRLAAGVAAAAAAAAAVAAGTGPRRTSHVLRIEDGDHSSRRRGLETLPVWPRVSRALSWTVSWTVSWTASLTVSRETTSAQ